MNVFFDVDDTLVSFDGSLRPHVKEVFQKLVEEGHKVYVWSGVGIRWEVVNRHGLKPYVTDCFLKPIYNYREKLKDHGVTVEPDFCVDDHPELVKALGGEAIKPYLWEDPKDREMWRIYEVITNFSNNHHS